MENSHSLLVYCFNALVHLIYGSTTSGIEKFRCRKKRDWKCLELPKLFTKVYYFHDADSYGLLCNASAHFAGSCGLSLFADMPTSILWLYFIINALRSTFLTLTISNPIPHVTNTKHTYIHKTSLQRPGIFLYLNLKSVASPSPCVTSRKHCCLQHFRIAGSDDGSGRWCRSRSRSRCHCLLMTAAEFIQRLLIYLFYRHIYFTASICYGGHFLPGRPTCVSHCNAERR